MSHGWDEMQECRAVGITGDLEAVENHQCFPPHLPFVEQDMGLGSCQGQDVMSPEREAETWKRLRGLKSEIVFFKCFLIF